VTTNGCRRSLVIKSPWSSPIPIDISRTAARVGPTPHPLSTSRIGIVTPTNPTTDPIERSIPPVMITNDTPIERIPNNALHRMMFWRLYADTNCGLISEVRTQMATNSPKMPRIFFTPRSPASNPWSPAS